MLSALVCGALVFPGLFCGSRKVLKSTFTQWSDADVVCVSERLVSAIHASLATAAGVTVMTSCRDVITDSHWLVNGFVLFGVPYVVFDIYAMYLSHYHTQKLGDFFIGCLFTTEFSTPFVSIGKILIQLGLNNTRLHRINGIIVLLSFFTCRILLFPFMYWMYGRQFGIPLHRVVFHLPLQCNVGNLVLLAPQIYWFILLLRKANRLYLRQRKGPARKD
ncbi:protein FAM57A [Oreochromis niloticus]|uniref:TLC domain-containing protein n=1 Tax=Oreochromis niloticus TaxID=8128 RepID=A0A669DQI3_ORENI|nr:protein FAM57A [Oreochromis niloticus]